MVDRLTHGNYPQPWDMETNPPPIVGLGKSWQFTPEQSWTYYHPEPPQGYNTWTDYVLDVIDAQEKGVNLPNPAGSTEDGAGAAYWLQNSIGYGRLAPLLDTSNPKIQSYLDSLYFNSTGTDKPDPFGLSGMFFPALAALGIVGGATALAGAGGAAAGGGGAAGAGGAATEAAAAGTATGAAGAGGVAAGTAAGGAGTLGTVGTIAKLASAGVGLASGLAGVAGGSKHAGTEATSTTGPGEPDPILTAGRELATSTVPNQISNFYNSLNTLRARANGSTAELMPSLMGDIRSVRGNLAQASQALSKRLGFAGGGQVQAGKANLIAGAATQEADLFGKGQQAGLANLINMLGSMQPVLSGAARPPVVTSGSSTTTSPYDTTNMGVGLAGVVSAANQLQKFYNRQKPPTVAPSTVQVQGGALPLLAPNNDTLVPVP